MFSPNEINQNHPDLYAFVYANDDASRKQYAQNLHASYVVMNGISYFRENLSPAAIVAGLGFLQHVKALEQVSVFVPVEDAPQALMKATQGGQLATAAYILEHYLMELSASSLYSALLMAIREQHPAILCCLLETPEVEQIFMTQWQEMFRHAAQASNPMVLRQLLPYSQCFERADRNRELSHQAHLLEFVHEKIESLRGRASHDVTSRLNVDLSKNETELCFYMLRHLITRNSSEFNNGIKFLLNIPSVQALAHEQVTPGQSNELFLSALTAHNTWAEELLILIPSVRALAEQHDFYHDEAALVRHKQRFWVNRLACIVMLQAAYPAPRDTPRLFQSVDAARRYKNLYEILNADLLGYVFSYLIPNLQECSTQEGMRFVNRAQIMLFDQGSRASYRHVEVAENEHEDDHEHVDMMQQS
ncbi:MAG: hypothetical protein P1U36_06000 [Legionellaceae bacterium]|nr:hypothetical protein [Legionellaceae bacterium]